jgi:hypothetical protein
LHFGQTDPDSITADPVDCVAGFALAIFSFLRVLKYRIEKTTRSTDAIIIKDMATIVIGSSVTATREALMRE